MFRVEIVIHGKTFACKRILLMDKAIIHGKIFMIEWRTAKTSKVFPLECFILYNTLVATICKNPQCSFSH